MPSGNLFLLLNCHSTHRANTCRRCRLRRRPHLRRRGSRHRHCPYLSAQSSQYHSGHRHCHCHCHCPCCNYCHCHHRRHCHHRSLSLPSLPSPAPSPGTAQHKMHSNREDVSGRLHGNGLWHNGRCGLGSHATVTHLSPKSKKMMSCGLSLVGFGNKRQKCRQAMSVRRS